MTKKLVRRDFELKYDAGGKGKKVPKDTEIAGAAFLGEALARAIGQIHPEPAGAEVPKQVEASAQIPLVVKIENFEHCLARLTVTVTYDRADAALVVEMLDGLR